MALFKTLPTPTYDLLPSWMVEVCLVLADVADVNFFLNSRNQGFPCWRSLFFSFFVLSTSNNVCVSMTSLTGYMSICGSLKLMQSLPVCMQARFGPPLFYDRAKKWTILYKMVPDDVEEDYDGQGHNHFMVLHARASTESGLEPLQFNWFQAAVRM